MDVVMTKKNKEVQIKKDIKAIAEEDLDPTAKLIKIECVYGYVVTR